jgi:hypothetical protein
VFLFQALEKKCVARVDGNSHGVIDKKPLESGQSQKMRREEQGGGVTPTGQYVKNLLGELGIV